MNRYVGLIFVIVVGAIIYGIVFQVMKNGDLDNVVNLFKNVKFGLGAPSVTPTRSNVKPSSLPEQQPQNELRPKFQPPQGFTAEQLSVFYRQVRIHSLSRNYSSNDKTIKQITIRSDYSLKNGINVSGWRVKGNKGDFLIPQAVNNFDPAFFGRSGDIIIGANNYIYIYGVSSPMGLNFRLNKCTGYLNNFYKFDPPLPNNCPNVDRKEIASFSGNCQNLITSLGACRIPADKDLNSPAVLNDSACRAYLDRLNYRGCYERNYAVSNFLSNEWRVWLGKNIPFDSEHDRLWLFDREGLLVDEYTY